MIPTRYPGCTDTPYIHTHTSVYLCILAWMWTIRILFLGSFSHPHRPSHPNRIPPECQPVDAQDIDAKLCQSSWWRQTVPAQQTPLRRKRSRLLRIDALDLLGLEMTNLRLRLVRKLWTSAWLRCSFLGFPNCWSTVCSLHVVQPVSIKSSRTIVIRDLKWAKLQQCYSASSRCRGKSCVRWQNLWWPIMYHMESPGFRFSFSSKNRESKSRNENTMMISVGHCRIVIHHFLQTSASSASQ